MITIVVLAGGMLACTSPHTSSGRTPEAEQMLTELKEVSRQNHFLFGHHDDPVSVSYTHLTLPTSQSV